jgi:cell division protein ZapB
MPQLTRVRRGYYSSAMSPNTPNNFEAELKALEKRVDELLAVNDAMREEIRALRRQQESLATERAQLAQKNDQVRARVEAMIGRLKTMEHTA